VVGIADCGASLLILIGLVCFIALQQEKDKTASLQAKKKERLEKKEERRQRRDPDAAGVEVLPLEGADGGEEEPPAEPESPDADRIAEEAAARRTAEELAIATSGYAAAGRYDGLEADLSKQMAAMKEKKNS